MKLEHTCESTIMFFGIVNIETIDILDKVFLDLITYYRSEVINGANLRQSYFGVMLVYCWQNILTTYTTKSIYSIRYYFVLNVNLQNVYLLINFCMIT
jgi:hypothetical protein